MSIQPVNNMTREASQSNNTTNKIQYPYPTNHVYNYRNNTHVTNNDVAHLGQRFEAFNTGYEPRNQIAGSAVSHGYNKLWGMENVDLIQVRNVLPSSKVIPPKVTLLQDNYDNSINCSPDILRCTLNKIPATSALLQKSRLPLGILIQPFKDLTNLPVIQSSTIVRCRVCRTYINPFVNIDAKRWKCNLCFRVNELPEEFSFDPVCKTYGDPNRRPEMRSATIEYIAPSEYMLRPPQPAIYLFLLDISQLAVESGYLKYFTEILLEEIDNIPGDARTQIGFISYNSSVHFYNLNESLSQPQEMIVNDIEDIFLPCPDDLLVNIHESKQLVKELLKQLPSKCANTHDNKSALGAALQAAYLLMSSTGGRVTVMHCCLPNHGPGGLSSREDPTMRAGKDVHHLNPAVDFYKRLALDCSTQQIAVDIFLLNSQYSDLATISGISRFSGGCVYHFPLFRISNKLQCERFINAFRRYLTRKIGFEAVMRVRCTRGLAIHSFHGNFFVRSTDLLSLPNVNPDSGFGMQVIVQETLSDLQCVSFQAALLYTSSKGERRIRVHTLCLPITASLHDILYSADVQCIVGLLAKMAVDRSLHSSLSDAREALINAVIDVYSAFKLSQNSAGGDGLLSPQNLALFPMYVLALLKFVAFRVGQSTRLDDRVFAMLEMKSLPLAGLIQKIYPDLYAVHNIENEPVYDIDGTHVQIPSRLHLSSEKLDMRGIFLLDSGDSILIFVGINAVPALCYAFLGLPDVHHITEEMYELPQVSTTHSERLKLFLNYLQFEKPFNATVEIIKGNSPKHEKFVERLIEDRSQSSFSYYEFIQHIKANVR